MQEEVYKFISRQTSPTKDGAGDPIVEWKTCKVSGQPFAIFQSDLDFYEKISPTFNGKKFLIPTPTLCPEERLRRRLAFYNERFFYRRNSHLTGNPIISIYSPDKTYKVLETKEWRSDKRNALDYGKDFDFTTSFSEQFHNLDMDVPKLASINDEGVGSQNCVYTTNFALGKDCFMCFEMGDTKNCCYCHHCNTSNDLIDCDTVINKSSFCYQCVYSSNIYNCIYLAESTDCSNCILGSDLQGCDACIACVGLKNQKYCFLNQQVTKEEYEYQINIVQSQGIGAFQHRFDDLLKSHPRKGMNTIGSTNSIGNNIFHSKNILGYNIYDSEKSRYCINSDRITNCFDLQCWKSELCYEGMTPDDGYNVLFSCRSWKCKYAYYCNDCHACTHCFGCIGLKNQEYCIFNKQYTKEEYEKIVPNIIEHMIKTQEWGEFYDPQTSPFGYNETVAQEHMPSTKEGIMQKGYKRSDYTIPFPDAGELVPASDLPTIDEATDDILQKIIQCESSGRPFKITALELAFYRKLKLPLPHKHPDIRNQERRARMPANQLHLRTCDTCGSDMLSVYKQESPFKIYCEDCYNKEIYG